MLRTILPLGLLVISLCGCNQTTNNQIQSNKNNEKPTVMAASLRPVVETRMISGFTVKRHSMDEKKRFAIGISATQRNQTSKHFEIAQTVLNDVCKEFGPPLEKNNFKLGQVAHIVGSNGYLSPAYDEASETAYLYLWCNVITRTI